MANRIDVRVSPFEKEMANRIAGEMGMSVSEMIRFIIYKLDPEIDKPAHIKYNDKFGNKIDAVEVPPIGLSILVNLREENKKADERFNEEADVITELRYLNMLIKNIANNENQIAHALNKISKSNPKNSLDFTPVQNQLDELKAASRKAQDRLENHFRFNQHNQSK